MTPFYDGDQLVERVLAMHLAALEHEVVQDLPKRPALHQLHREVEPTVLSQADVVHRRDAGVLELARGLRLGDEVQPLVAADGRLLLDQLHRHLAPQVLVGHEHDLAHAARSDRHLHPVLLLGGCEVRVAVRGGLRPLHDAVPSEFHRPAPFDLKPGF
jgi:hypothetical protein